MVELPHGHRSEEDELRAEIEALRAAARWRPSSEVPDKPGIYAVGWRAWTGQFWFEMAEWRGARDRWWTTRSFTHWRPVGEPAE